MRLSTGNMGYRYGTGFIDMVIYRHTHIHGAGSDKTSEQGATKGFQAKLQMGHVYSEQRLALSPTWFDLEVSSASSWCEGQAGRHIV
jgi:hypothetical protein